MTHPLPENIRKRMPKEDRTTKETFTMGDIKEKVEAQSEKDLQLQIVQFLRLRDVKAPGMNGFGKKSSMPSGWPDFAFVYQGVPFALEVKVGYNKQSEDQKDIECAMLKDGWRYHVVRSLPEVKMLLDSLTPSK